MPQIYTNGGYPLSDVISVLQKDIRRGNEENVMYWCYELLPKFEAYLWRRLITIANEDIGIASVETLLLVPSQANLYFSFRDEGKTGAAKLILANTVLAMCRAPKSRIADHFQCAVLQDKVHSPQKPIPDYGYDKHTSKGRAMGRGTDHWLTEGCLLDPVADVPDPYAERAAKWWKSPLFKKIDWAKRTAAGKKPAQGSLFDAFPDGEELTPETIPDAEIDQE